jgi:hypothetical protein
MEKNTNILIVIWFVFVILAIKNFTTLVVKLMANYRKAPKLYHDIDKSKLDDGMFINIPQKILHILFENLDGKCGNQIKLIMMFVGTIGNGNFAISEKWIMDMCGFSQPCYIRARQELVKKGWLEVSAGKIVVKISKILACCDSMEELKETCDDINNPCYDTPEACYDIEEACCDNIPNTKVKNNNNKENDNNDVFLNLYDNLSCEYFIQKENIKTRIEKKLFALNRSNIDLYDLLSFWINIISELKENRFDKNISQSSVIEYDLSTALNKYDTVYNTNFKSGYKIYKDDILDIYDQEKYNKIISCIGDRFYTFTEDHLFWFNNDSKKAYKISTFMRYRNLKEYKSTKKQKKESETEY